MKQAAHSAGDGSFGRSAGVAAGRAAMLLGVAVLLGLLLLNTTDAEPQRVTTNTTTGGTADTSPSESEDGEAVPPDAMARPPGEVNVLVANATRTEGLASRITERLRVAGYMVKPPTDAPKEDASVVHFTSGYEVEAQIVAQTLELPPSVVQPMPTPAPVSDLREAHVLVLAGPELAAQTTTTTAAGATTTSA